MRCVPEAGYCGRREQSMFFSGTGRLEFGENGERRSGGGDLYRSHDPQLVDFTAERLKNNNNKINV